MSEVVFPEINLKLQLSRIAFSIGKIDIYWYAILMMSAFVISLIIFKIKDGKFGIKFSEIIDLSLYVIPISIISARIYYVLFNLNYYIRYPIQILNLKAGGLAIYGGIIGGGITCFILCKKRKINILDLFDLIVPCLALGQALGRWGNFINIEAYGVETNLPWRMGIYEAGKYIEVHPTFLYESIVTFFLFIFLTIISRKRKYKGEITLVYLIVYSFARMIIEGFRTDSLMFGNIRISQLLSLIIFIVSICRFLAILIKLKNKKQTDVIK